MGDFENTRNSPHSSMVLHGMATAPLFSSSRATWIREPGKTLSGGAPSKKLMTSPSVPLKTYDVSGMPSSFAPENAWHPDVNTASRSNKMKMFVFFGI